MSLINHSLLAFVFVLCVISVTDGVPIKAVFVLLIENKEKVISSSVSTLKQLDKNFNSQYGYDLVVFHEGLHNSDRERIIKAHTGRVIFEELFDLNITYNVAKEDVPEIIEGFSERTSSIGYRSMCRFFSGAIFTNPVMQDYDYMWRVDSDASYLCPISYDPFAFMKENKYIYGWIIKMYEEPPISSRTLWKSTNHFLEQEALERNRLDEITTIYGGYDRCHYWNNFEILDLSFFRAPLYTKYFNFLDKEGGFYLYRWGDALVRTIALHAFVLPSKVFRFNDIGYSHQGICQNTCNCDKECDNLPEGVTGFCRSLYPRIVAFDNRTQQVILLLFAITIGFLLVYIMKKYFNRQRFIRGEKGGVIFVNKVL